MHFNLLILNFVLETGKIFRPGTSLLILGGFIKRMTGLVYYGKWKHVFWIGSFGSCGITLSDFAGTVYGASFGFLMCERVRGGFVYRSRMGL